MSTKNIETTNTNKLLSWRESMGYSQQDACEQLECSVKDWVQWESGKRPVPRYIDLACAALALGIGKE
jgi:transcriptional regulator with XRE-family HTH domain